MSISSAVVRPCSRHWLLAVLFATGLSAADTQLRLGPDEFIVGVELVSSQLEHSATRVDEAVIHPVVRGRFFDIGIEVDGWLAAGDDESYSGAEFAELTQAGLRLDYLIETSGLFQVLPFFEHQNYVGIPHPTDDEVFWLGADFWYLTPLEGLEVGANSAVDLGGDHGWYLSLGSRQFLQIDPLDLRSWQTVTFGTTDYHESTSGADVSGINAIEIGAEGLLPLPWEDLWASLRAEVHVWVQGADRRAVADDAEFVFALGVEYRMPR